MASPSRSMRRFSPSWRHASSMKSSVFGVSGRVWSPELASVWPCFIANFGLAWVVISPGGVSRRVVADVGPTLDLIFLCRFGRRGGQGWRGRVWSCSSRSAGTWALIEVLLAHRMCMRTRCSCGCDDGLTHSFKGATSGTSRGSAGARNEATKRDWSLARQGYMDTATSACTYASVRKGLEPPWR
jgi:hypothetical protein